MTPNQLRNIVLHTAGAPLSFADMENAARKQQTQLVLRFRTEAETPRYSYDKALPYYENLDERIALLRKRGFSVTPVFYTQTDTYQIGRELYETSYGAITVTVSWA